MNKKNNHLELQKDFTIPISFGENSASKAFEEDEDFIYIGGHVSTTDSDSHRDIIPTSTWQKPESLERFRKNPIVLLNHDIDKPIGKAILDEIKVTEKGLYMMLAIDKTIKEASQIKKGILKAFSIRFILENYYYNSELDAFVITELKLLEVSVVSIPANENTISDYLKSLNNNEKMKEKDEKTALDKFLDFFAPKQVTKSQDEILTGVATEVQEKLKKATDEISALKSANDALNSELENLRKDFANLKTELNSKTTELDSFAIKSETLESENKTLKSEKSALETQIKGLKDDLKLLQLGGKSLPKDDGVVADPAILVPQEIKSSKPSEIVKQALQDYFSKK